MGKDNYKGSNSTEKTDSTSDIGFLSKKSNEKKSDKEILYGTKKEKTTTFMLSKESSNSKHLVNDIFLAMNPKKHEADQGKGTQSLKPDDSKGKPTTDKIDKFNNAMKNFQNSLERTLKNVSEEQKKVLNKMGEKFENVLKSALQKSDEQFYKQLILILLGQQQYSKDLQGIGQANVTPVNQESYL